MSAGTPYQEVQEVGLFVDQTDVGGVVGAAAMKKAMDNVSSA